MISKILFYVGIAIVAIYLGGLIRVVFYERRINKLHSELNEKIEKEKQRCVVLSDITAGINKLKDNYSVQIDDLERKRRFILDKLPFLKK